MASPGEILGSYELLERLGGGGGGAVFRARHILLGRDVAIKVMNDALVHEQQLISRFFHEARIVNAIRHPNIIDIVDFLDLYEPRRVAYVMELLHGRPLGQVAAEGMVTAKQAANACLQIASVLTAVHEMRVIHRDLKPDNVFVLEGADADWSAIPSIKVFDFGVAKLDASEVQHRTQTGVTVGTPLYMSPEQFLTAPVSPASDIYALGEILYEALAGHRLFDGSNREILKQKISASPVGSFIFPQLEDPAPITALIRRCIAVAPEERPSLAEITAVLRGVADGATLIVSAHGARRAELSLPDHLDNTVVNAPAPDLRATDPAPPAPAQITPIVVTAPPPAAITSSPRVDEILGDMPPHRRAGIVFVVSIAATLALIAAISLVRRALSDAPTVTPSHPVVLEPGRAP